MKHRTRTDKTYSIPKGITIGTVISMALLLMGVSILACLIVNGTLGSEVINSVSLVILALASYAGVLLSSKMIGKQYAIIGLIQSAVILALLIGTHIFFFEGAFRGIGGTIAAVCVGAAGACLSVMAQKRFKRKRRNR